MCVLLLILLQLLFVVCAYGHVVSAYAWCASATEHHLWTNQTIVQNVYVWLVGTRCLVSEC